MALRPALQAVLDAMAGIPVPATVANVELVPDERLEGGGRRTYRALHARASVAGADVLDAVLAEAAAGTGGCDAQPGARGSDGIADLALRCASQRIVLIDVLDTGRRVKLLGAAAGRYAGRGVAIRSPPRAPWWRGRSFATTGRSAPRRRCRGGASG